MKNRTFSEYFCLRVLLCSQSITQQVSLLHVDLEEKQCITSLLQLGEEEEQNDPDVPEPEHDTGAASSSADKRKGSKDKAERKSKVDVKKESKHTCKMCDARSEQDPDRHA